MRKWRGMVAAMACVGATACGGAIPPAGLRLVGVPVDPTMVDAFCADYTAAARAMHGTAHTPALPRSMEIHFLPASYFTAHGPYPNVILGPVPVVTTDAPVEGWTLRETALAHELTHVLFGDPAHTREDLWGCPGLLSGFVGYCDGHDPASGG